MIAIGADHVGYEYKKLIIEYLEKKGYKVKDFGCDGVDSVDYPVYGEKVARAVASGECDRGIVICGTGIGISIAANRVKGARCALCGDPFTAKMTRFHNDANMIALGAWIIGIGIAFEIIDVWLSTEFEGGRHIRRIEMLG
ncbi:MAG: ribose 5-phosphate isomerase B [Oscillospiraceae bacterium]|nr:ribose 5-phosphate isomerase B [Oscillospiraceae bacterium]